MIVNKGKFIENMHPEKLKAGCIKFNIPSCEDIYSGNGEGVWGYADEVNKKKYEDNSYTGKITVILLNQPFEYFDKLNWGDEVTLVCHGSNRPTLDPEFVIENLQ